MLDDGLPEEVLFGMACALWPVGSGATVGHFLLISCMSPLGNLDLLPPSGKSTKPGAAPIEHKGLVPHNGSLINVGSLLQRAEQQDSGRLYLENKIHTLELKLGECGVTGTKGTPLFRPQAFVLCSSWLSRESLSAMSSPTFQRRAITVSQPLK